MAIDTHANDYVFSPRVSSTTPSYESMLLIGFFINLDRAVLFDCFTMSWLETLVYLLYRTRFRD